MLDLFAALFPTSGIARYVNDVAHALRSLPEAPPALFAYPSSLRRQARAFFRPEELHEVPLGWRRMRVVCTTSAWLGYGCDWLYDQPTVFHSPMGYGPLLKHALIIANVHDLTFIEHPEWHPFRTSFFMQQTVPRVAAKAHLIICHSAFVRNGVVTTFDVDPARVVILPPPLGHTFAPMTRQAARSHVLKRFGLDGEFILHVSTLEPRKNQVRLVQAYEQVRRAGFSGPLVMVGRDGWRVGRILAKLEHSSARDHIIRIPSADDRDLAGLYGACTLTVFPSLEEGFGMPLLEAMACGAATVTSNRSALVEYGAECALRVTPEDTDAIAGAMIALWRDVDLRDRLSAGGPAEAESYAFRRWATRLFALYASVLHDARSGSGCLSAGTGVTAAR
jgi:glycosyltransferase involved in cell wall biosynthesis